jgi:Domain of unknown function (DUF4123)
MERSTDQIANLLFSEDEMNVFAILDGASIPNLLEQLYNCDLEYECLYRGELAPDLAEVAPYLVQLQQKSAFTEWVLEKGWGRHWGVFAKSTADLRSLRRHLRRFLIVHDSAAKPLYFRYYDPRVLRVYLSTCNAAELETIFGPVDRYVMEDEQASGILSFRNNTGVLVPSRDELKEN